MDTLTVAVVIPVTNKPYYLQHLDACLDSIEKQTVRPLTIIVEDGPCPSLSHSHITVHIPARVGVPSAFNIGIATAFSLGEDRVLMMGCDDILHPNCIATLSNTCNEEGFHWLDLQQEGGVIQDWPSGHALITKKFWLDIGGYPIEAPLACDTVLLHLIPPELIHHVETETPLIYVRRNDKTYTGSRDPRWLDIIFQTRTLLKTLQEEKDE